MNESERRLTHELDRVALLAHALEQRREVSS